MSGPFYIMQPSGLLSEQNRKILQDLANPPVVQRLPLVILVNGQSNAAAAPAVPFGYSELTALLSPNILGYGHTAQAWVPVVDGSANARANHGGGGTGPGPGLGQIGTRVARAIANETGSTVYTYALAYTSQGIAYFRKSSATKAYFEDGSQHAALNNYNLLKSYVDASGVIPQLYIWVQGEANAGSTPDAHYAELNGHWADLQADYPGIKLLIVSTIAGAYGRADDRGGAAGGTVAGVRLAQKRLASKNPSRVFFVDTTDMRGLTAWQGPHYSSHAATYIGNAEVALRIMSALRGEAPRPAVTPANHPQDLYSWDQVWGYRRSISNGTLVLWQNDLNEVGSQSLAVGSGTPEHVPSDPNCGGRTVMRLDHTASESLTANNISGGNRWVFFWVGRPLKASFTGVNRTVWQLEPSAGGARIAFQYTTSGAHSLFLEGIGNVNFTGAASEGDIMHSYCVTYDGDALEAKLWVDGFPYSTLTSGLANVTTGATARINIGAISASAYYGGELGHIFAKAEPVAMPDDETVAAMHAWARIEYELET